MNHDFLTVEELAAKLRVKRSWVYGHADLLGVYRLGKYLRFSWPRVCERLDNAGPLVSKPNDQRLNLVNKGPGNCWEQIGNRFPTKLS